MKKKISIEEKVDELIILNKTLVALELAKGGLTHSEIGKCLKMAAGSVNKLIKGYKPPGERY